MSALSAIILAAGKGTRMNSDLPKVAHRVADRPMVEWVARACAEAGCQRIVLVVGHGREHIQSLMDGASINGARIEYAIQDEQLGTGHAVRCAESLFKRERDRKDHDVVVLAGDGPLIRAATIAALLERHRSTGAAATLATSLVDDPAGYGRIVRDERGGFCAIVEHKNASPEQLAILEINPSYYCFDAGKLFAALEEVPTNAQTGEQYVTDVPALLLRRGERVEVIDAVPSEDVLSINTPEQLAEVDTILRARLAKDEEPAIGSEAHGGAA